MPKIPFTPANAREMALRSVLARKAAKDAENSQAPNESLQATEQSEDYTEQRLTRTRKQIDMLSDALEEEDDPQRIDRLASAIARLSEIERQLANRPLPGSLKPSSKPSRGQSYPTLDPRPIEPVPGPATTTNSVPPVQPKP